MNESILNEKELLLMETIKEENSKTIDEKMADKLNEKEYQKTNQKQIEKDSFFACENDLKDSIDRVFRNCLYNSCNLYEVDLTLNRFYNIDYRNEYIKTFGKTTVERDYIDKIYDKVLKQVYNKWKKHVEYNQTNEIIEQQKVLQEQLEQEKKKQERFTENFVTITLIAIFVWAIILIFNFWLAVKIIIILLIAVLIISPIANAIVLALKKQK